MAKKRRKKGRKSRRPSPSRIEAPGSEANFFVNVRQLLVLSFLAILVFLIYSNTLGVPFIFDDLDNIQNNPHIRLTRVTLEGITRAAIESHASGRPLANISFALNYYFNQYDVMGYHLVNILIHIATGVFLYLFVKATLSIPSLRSRYGPHGWIPFFAALIWLVHPIQTQSVTYIVQRMNSAAAMFYVLSFLLYAKGRLAEEKGKKWAFFAGCMFAGILALGFKEIAATLPFFIFLYEWYFFQELSRAWLKRRFLPLVGILVLLAIVAFIYLRTNPVGRVLTLGYEVGYFTLTERVLTEFRVVIFYITLLVFPHPSRLNLEHDFPLSHSLTDPITTLFSIAIIAGLIVLAFYIAKKDRLISFCILWFFGNLVIESSVVGIELIYEHRTYLPSMLVSVMAVTFAYRHIRPKWLGISMLCAAAIIFSVWTYQRNIVWSNDVAFWRDCVKKSPKRARPHNNLGATLARKGKLKEAEGHFFEALRISPDFAEARNNMGNALQKQGKLQEAAGHLSEALRIKPDYAEAHFNLGNVLKHQGSFEEAMSHFSEAVRIRPDYANALNNLGVELARKGRIKEAMSHFSRALRIKPDYTDAQRNMERAVQIMGRSGKASDTDVRP